MPIGIQYILVRSNTNINGHQVTELALENCAPFTKCTTEIDGRTIDDAENLDLLIPMHNLIEYN